jgi:hypothetical protein
MVSLLSLPYPLKRRRPSRLRRTCLLGAALAGTVIVAVPFPAWAAPSWSIVSSPNNGKGDNEFSGVSCVSATSCKTVREYFNSSNVEQTLSSPRTAPSGRFSRAPTPGQPATPSAACHACRPSGARLLVSPSTPSVAIRLSSSPGTAPSGAPTRGRANNYLSDVTCRSTSLCVAVGYYQNVARLGEQFSKLRTDCGDPVASGIGVSFRLALRRGLPVHVRRTKALP